MVIKGFSLLEKWWRRRELDSAAALQTNNLLKIKDAQNAGFYKRGCQEKTLFPSLEKR